MSTKPDWYYTQSGVIPFRQSNGKLEVLLVTSRKRRHWVIPKGVKEPTLTPIESAANEAVEEAGVLGRVLPEALGTYDYQKWNGTCRVEVFLMEVEWILEEWPEDFRDRKWLAPEEAARRVEAPGLKKLLLETTVGATRQSPEPVSA